MNVLGLFSGIGGFEYGFQQAGYDIKALCEIEPYPKKVLQKNFPDIPIINDVKLIAELCKECVEEYNSFHVLDIPYIFTGGVTFIDDHNTNTTSLGGWCELSDKWTHIWYERDYEKETEKFYFDGILYKG